MTRWTEVERVKIMQQSMLSDVPEYELGNADAPDVDVTHHTRRRPRRKSVTVDRDVDDEQAMGTHRALDHHTSREAGLRDLGRKGNQRQRLANAFLFAWPGGMTDEEAATLAGISLRSSPWKRCTELRSWGYIADTGFTRLTESGSPAKVWRLTDEGRTRLLLPHAVV